MIEIDNNTSSVDGNITRNILWSSLLHDTQGKLTKEMFVLPDKVRDTPVDFSIYIITEDIGQNSLTVRRADIV